MDIESSNALDQRDMERLCSGHDAALNDLMERHATRLFHYLIRELRDEADAEDVAQDAFVRVFQNRHKFKPKLRFSTWLYAIATNLARDRQRWHTRHPQISLDADKENIGTGLKDLLPAAGAGPGDSLASSERAAAVQMAVAGLPEDLRVPLILAEYEERSHQEISDVLNCTPKAVEMRLYRARKQLREELAQWL